jgi:6-phosphogluconolactonase
MAHRFILLLFSFGIALSTSQTFAGSWLFVSLLREKTIVTFERNPKTGELIRRHETKCPAEPACMNVSHDRKTLFVSFRSTGKLASFRIETTGKLSALGAVDGGSDPAYLLPDAQGRFLLAAYYQSNKVTVNRLTSGVIGELIQTIPTAEKAHGIAFNGKNSRAYVSHTGANRIYQFRFNKNSGRLQPNQPAFVSTPQTDHPRHITLHPSERWAYTSNEAGDSLGLFSIDPKSGTLRAIQTVSSIPSDFDGSKNATARCEMTPNGRFVYVANRGHDSIACFSIDPKTGRATSLGQIATEKTPRSFSIDPAGKYLYAAGQSTGKIATFQIQKDGRLKRIATHNSGPMSWWVQAVDTK